MRLDYLWISKYKNLNDISIDFDETTLSTILIGENGTAKSNLLEAIVHIFRNLDLDESPPFDYKLKYIIRDNEVQIDADSSKRSKISIYVNNESVSQSLFSNKLKNKYLPKNVFGYYSGLNTRFKELFTRHQELFYRKIIRDISPPLRPLFYAENEHAQFVLLAFLSFKEETSRTFLEKYLDITGFREAKFVLKEPYWYNNKDKGDLFWGAGGVVRTFLDDLASVADVSEKRIERVLQDTGRTKREERMDVTIRDLKTLQKLASKYENNVTFFKMLESMLLSDLISELKIEVSKTINKKIEFGALSEGERQLLVVLGLLKFMKSEESLFLLDEPDTHLNPVWKYEYLNLINEIVGKNENSHLIIATHDPLLISGLNKNQILIFKKDSKKEIIISRPKIDPIGYGVDGLLTSEYYGLKTTLDEITLNLLNKKHNYIVKDKLDSDDIDDLKDLNEKLNNFGLNYTFRDNLYNKFLIALKKYEKNNKISLTHEEIEEQEKIAYEIIQEIMEE